MTSEASAWTSLASPRCHALLAINRSSASNATSWGGRGGVVSAGWEAPSSKVALRRDLHVHAAKARARTSSVPAHQGQLRTICSQSVHSNTTMPCAGWGWASGSKFGVTTSSMKGWVMCGPKATGGTTTKPESQLVTSQDFCNTTSPAAPTGEGRVSRPLSARTSNPPAVVSAQAGQAALSATPAFSSSRVKSQLAVN